MDASAARARPRVPLLLAIAAVIGFLAITIALPATAHADVEDFRFDSFDARMTLTRDVDDHAALSVTETLVAVFPEDDQNRGIIRAIPTTTTACRCTRRSPP